MSWWVLWYAKRPMSRSATTGMANPTATFVPKVQLRSMRLPFLWHVVEGHLPGNRFEDGSDVNDRTEDTRARRSVRIAAHPRHAAKVPAGRVVVAGRVDVVGRQAGVRFEEIERQSDGRRRPGEHEPSRR